MPLIFVPTPLGNLRDVTLRALDVLSQAELIVAEDTRVARRLLSALQIAAPDVWSYREANAAAVTPAVLKRACTAMVAVTADAGTPGISDPGSELLAAARAASVPVEVLPGPSAAIGVALLSGFSLRRFIFEGFPPRTSAARRARFTATLQSHATSIWFESPQRIRASLADLAAVAPNAAVFVVREYTKLHEQHLTGPPATVAAQLPDPVRGEIAFAVAACNALGAAAQPESNADAAMDALLAGGERVGEVAKQLAAQGFGDRKQLYARAAERKAARKTSTKQH